MKWLLDALSILGGVSFVAIAVVSYLSKLYLERFRRKQDEKIKELQSTFDKTNSEIKAKLEKTNYVSKVQFDKEFSIYHELWSCIFEVADAVSKLRPVLDHFSTDETPIERKNRRLKTFYERYNPLVVAIEANRPFYYDEIYVLACKYREVCRKEAVEYQHYEDYPYEKEYWTSHENNMKEIKSYMEQCSEAIRHRIYSLTIIE